MKRIISVLVLFMTVSLAYSQSAMRVTDNGDLALRRYSDGDLDFKRALVPWLNQQHSLKKLVVNYEGDFNGGVQVHGVGMFLDGKLGVGTNNPDERLTVRGKIHAEEVKVDLDVPADYVFEKYYTGESELKEDYEMPTLEQVEEFTEENHHLPGVPSAQEIQENGLKLGEMNNLLLQKVEELTLYIIEQEKRIKALEAKLK